MNQNLNGFDQNSMQTNNQVMQQTDLTKTQVLNFNEVEQVANYEKKTSKKPAIFLAIIGILLIAGGFLYPTIEKMISKEETTPTKENKVSSNTNKNDTDVNSTLTCNLVQNITESKIVSTTTETLNFTNDKLQNYEKTIDLKSSETNLSSTPEYITNFDTALTAIMETSIDSYNIVKVAIANDTNSSISSEYQAKIQIDLTTFDKTKLTDSHKNNTFTNVEYDLNDSKEIVKQKALALGYTCS